MKVVRSLAVVDGAKCNGCRICERVCPVLSLKMEDHLAVIDDARCRGCAACEQRCPQYAITMVKREQPVLVTVDLSGVDYAQIEQICRQAGFHPEQVVCECTATRAEEVAAVILQGAGAPEEISFRTGMRTGCKVGCIQPMLRILEAAGISPQPPKGGWQWYGRTVTIWEIPAAVKQKYAARGFYFEEDQALLDKAVAAPLHERRNS